MTGLGSKVLSRQDRKRIMEAEAAERIKLLRKTLNASRWRLIAIGCLLLATSAGSFYTQYQQRKIRARLAELSAPTWANFQLNSPTMSYQPSLSENGVPKEVTIDNQRWSLVQVDHFTGADGKPDDPRTGPHTGAETFCKRLTIAYLYAEDPVSQRVTLMHELLHAGACLHGGDTWWNSEHPTETVHDGIERIAEFETTFLRSNPEFAAWYLEVR
jgi:hypothetical protein